MEAASITPMSWGVLVVNKENMRLTYVEVAREACL